MKCEKSEQWNGANVVLYRYRQSEKKSPLPGSYLIHHIIT